MENSITNQTSLVLTSSDYYNLLFYLIIFIIYAIIIKAVLELAFQIFKKITEKTKTHLDDLIVHRVKPVTFILLLGLGAYYLLYTTSLLSLYENIINRIFLSFIFIVGGWALYSIVNVFVEHYGIVLAKKTKSNIDDTLFPFIKTALKIAVVVVVILQILSVWKIDITPLLASAGIFGLAIAFAAQETIKNLFGGVSISVDRALKVDDWVILDGQKMKVLEVGVRSTKFLTLDGTMKIYPNSVLAESIIENLNEPNNVKKKVKINVGVSYGSDPKKVKEILIDEARKIDKVDKETVKVFMTDMGDFKLEFLLVCEVPSVDDVWTTKTTLIENIYTRLNKEGIEIPFPIRTVYLKESGEKHDRK